MHHIAQANYSQWISDISEKSIQTFLKQVELIHHHAENSKGYVWRYDYDPHSHTLDSLFGVERIIFNMTVWETIDDLKNFSFKTMHGGVMKRRTEWFTSLPVQRSVLWWVRDNHKPTAKEAKDRFELLRNQGATEEAFTFRQVFLAPA